MRQAKKLKDKEEGGKNRYRRGKATTQRRVSSIAGAGMPELRRMSSAANFNHREGIEALQEKIAASGDDRMPRHSMLLAGGAFKSGLAKRNVDHGVLDADGIRDILEKVRRACQSQPQCRHR